MPPIGAPNPLPFRPGGGPTPVEKALDQLKRAVGEGGSADRDDGIDGTWRLARSRALAAATESELRASLQAFPHLATDALPYYERTLHFSGAGTDVERRELVVEAWTTRQDVDLPNLEDELQRIDSRFSLLHQDPLTQVTTVFGRAFASQDGVEPPAFGGDGYSRLPNYSTEFFVRVRFAAGYSGLLNENDQGLVERARARLFELIPSWCDFTISTGSWQLGVTPIGQGEI